MAPAQLLSVELAAGRGRGALLPQPPALGLLPWHREARLGAYKKPNFLPVDLAFISGFCSAVVGHRGRSILARDSLRRAAAWRPPQNP